MKAIAIFGTGCTAMAIIVVGGTATASTYSDPVAPPPASGSSTGSSGDLWFELVKQLSTGSSSGSGGVVG
ncbi:hypothetical protein HLB23_25465 [Nocardia uniformis]|uniref:Uncharacterized protein n=1 Tax=Nocardia uniformis TaxID=53432 RepID=A0A849C3A0_9NOCA|nr:hypothetical protein [Nocardia uniformis]NNH73164.1 hypothetical protein [Nocardia uniformis]